MPVPERVPIAYEPNYRTGYVGTWAGGQFMGNVVRKSGGRRSAPWLAYLHEFDAHGTYLGSRAVAAGTGEDGRRTALAMLRGWLNDLSGFAYGDIAIKPFRAEYDGNVYGLMAADGQGTDRAELHPDRLGFHEPWDGTYST